LSNQARDLRTLSGVSIGGRVIAYVTALAATAAIAGVLPGVASSSAAVRPSPTRAPTAHPSAHLPAGTVVVNLPQTRWPHLVAPGFLGLGVEYKTLLRYAGGDAKAVDPVFEQLVRNLSPGEPAQIRIGGDTTNWSWWPVPGMARPPGVSQTLTPHWANVANAFVQAVNARLIMGINIKPDNVKVAVTEARQLLSRMPTGSIEAFELGNEPDLFSGFGAGTGTYNFDTFLRAWTRIANAMPRQVPLAGPSFTGSPWARDLGRFLAKEPLVRLATGHRYPLKACGDPSSPVFPSVANLLSPQASYELAQGTVQWIKTAHADHLPIRIDEMNTTPCPGGAIVLRTFAESLWGLRVLFEMANVGADGVNVQTTAAATDDLFTPTESSNGWEAAVQPEYYGLLMFAKAVPPGARLVALSKSGTAPTQVWATRAPDGTIRVVVMNLASQPQSVAVNAGASLGRGKLERLEGSSLTTTSGVTLGGQTFGSETTTGRLRGRPRIFTVRPRGHDYLVSMPPLSAAMLTIQ
jgi:hypothetical protein